MSDTQPPQNFYGDGLFDWQLSDANRAERWNLFTYNKEKYWGDFPAETDTTEAEATLPRWAIGPFTKHPANPVLAPTPGAWDQGRYDGGVHNGSCLRMGEQFYYVYRGEQPIDIPTQQHAMDYICDIGLATSLDGVVFTKDSQHSPFFRHGPHRRFSYEDVNIVRWLERFHLFCNQWDWESVQDPRHNGVFLATSSDLRHWDRHGIVFPAADRIHRNGVVLQNPQNAAVRPDGRFVMYINDGLVAYSTDLVHWESEPIAERWPGGEGCVAITDYNPASPEDIVLFTGGHHTGHFYAIGEVLFHRSRPTQPRAWLPRPALQADSQFPWEDGRQAQPPHAPISSYRDCIFVNGLTQFAGRWWLYYGGSEYYTCLATAPVHQTPSNG